jgi:biotin transport system permease protein
MIFQSDASNDPFQKVTPTMKLIALFGLSLILFILSSLYIICAIAVIIFVTIFLTCKPAFLHWLKAWPLLLTIAVVVIWNAIAVNTEAALIVLLRLSTLSLFATAVTVTTSIKEFINTLTMFARPLEKLGLVRATDVGLAIGLVIRFVPDVQMRYRAIAEAHRARGLKLRLSTIIVPMVIGTLQGAENIANAIDARNIRSIEPDEKGLGDAD